MRRRRWRGLGGRPVEHFVELPEMAATAEKAFVEVIEQASPPDKPSRDACAAAFRSLTHAIGHMAAIKCLTDESDTTRMRGDEQVEIEEARPFLTPVSFDAVVARAREARHAVDVCYRRVGVAIQTSWEPPPPYTPRATYGEGGRIEF